MSLSIFSLFLMMLYTVCCDVFVDFYNSLVFDNTAPGAIKGHAKRRLNCLASTTSAVLPAEQSSTTSLSSRLRTRSRRSPKRISVCSIPNTTAAAGRAASGKSGRHRPSKNWTRARQAASGVAKRRCPFILYIVPAAPRRNASISRREKWIEQKKTRLASFWAATEYSALRRYYYCFSWCA